MRSRSRDVVVADRGKSKIASKRKVFVASFVEHDRMFKETKCEKTNKSKPRMAMRRCQKHIFFRKATRLIMNK